MLRTSSRSTSPRTLPTYNRIQHKLCQSLSTAIAKRGLETVTAAYAIRSAALVDKQPLPDSKQTPKSAAD